MKFVSQFKINPFRVAVALPGLALFSQGPLLADTVIVAPVNNAEIRQHSPDTVITPGLRNPTDVVSGTLGASAQFEIRRAVYKFDLSGKIPAGAVITSVSLRMPVIYKIPTGAANSTFDLRRLLLP